MTGHPALGVPTEVYAALLASSDAFPVGPMPADPAAAVEWWERHAQAEEVAQQAYERLHAWAVATEQPPAVTMAVAEAVDARKVKAQECRRGAARAREGQL